MSQWTTLQLPQDDNNSASSSSPLFLVLFGLVLGFAGGGYKNRGQMREDWEINRTRMNGVKSTKNQWKFILKCSKYKQKGRAMK